MHSSRSKTITYPTVCTWFGALEFASTLADEPAARKLRGPISSRYGKFYGEWASHIPPANHVDNSMFGCLPLSVYAYTGDERALNQGLAMADAQWAEPKPEDKEINGMFNYEERMKLWKGGYTPQTRLWMDDMFMITILQLNAFRQSERRVYAERASHEMLLYLDKMQRADGLFDHGPGAPFTWARGNGWMAAGTAMLLKSLPVDDPTIWPETSGSAMFAYAFIEGAKHGWLDASVYAPAARKAFIALQDYIEPNGDVRDVCCGTNIGNSREYYDKRRRITGDLHGQAPLIWCCAALGEYVK
jgi:rhamnogalacturonyl hydrolase YesR